MITKFENEYREVAAVYTQATHFLASRWFTPAEIDAGAPELSSFRWKALSRHCRLFVYKVDGRVLGFIGLHSDGSLEGPFVQPGPRRLAVTQALLDHASAVARSLGIEAFTAVVADRSVRDLFRTSGFVSHRSTEWSLGSLRVPAVEVRKA